MSVYEIYFSPTGGTKKVADIMAEVFEEPVKIDLIKTDISQTVFQPEDLCLMAVPSYGGRVPTVVVEQLKAVKGNGAKAALIAVYGNRHIDDTLMELYDVMTEVGFTCIAGVEAIAEHSLMHQFAAGRPDAEDEPVLKKIAETIKEKFLQGTDGQQLQLPGSHEYKEYGGVPMKPAVNRKCISCGLCAKECPAGAIPADNPKATDKDACISCMHCVAICPKNARHYSKLLSTIAAKKMKKACADRKENKLYI